MILDEILIDLYLQIHTVDDARNLVDEIVWREINAHVAAEREACAKVCEDFADGTSAYEVHHRFAAYKCADLIRKRGKNENIS